MTENELIINLTMWTAAMHPSETPRRVIKHAKEIAAALVVEGYLTEEESSSDIEKRIKQRAKEESEIIPP